ncbi:glycosyltransferase involved in cell wall biosynthesis [Melghirimyces profundicolus]|uniref:Glycosyltransferase involved in cell wall biosynthesis n=1 Tax=Melghirimyces profundicolus TaxID=1242148 RepID=A0A2T6BW80_9BACL|nr:glycosyltransferase [Melghirimyces profundicolus]PTX60335.1 glycosyltransferase involved in cell wall biosynthesis [Melghirimyces profundicolus]
MNRSSVRVLMLLNHFHVGGTETYTLSLTRELLRQGTKVVIAGQEGQMAPRFRHLGCPVYILSDVRMAPLWNPWQKTWQYNPRESRQLRNIILRENIDLIHAHEVSIALSVKEIVHEKRIPLVFTVHGQYYNASDIKRIARTASAVISVSPPIQDWLKNNGMESRLIPNGIDTREFHFDAESSETRLHHQIPPDAVVVLYAARLTWKKGQIAKQFVEACGRLKKESFPHLHAVIVGDGSQTSEIKKEIRKIQYPQSPFIHLLGSREDMPRLYSMSDGVVGTGRVALEAMACRRPVIAAGCEGLLGLVTPESHEEAWNGYFGDHRAEEPCTVQGLLREMEKLLLITRMKERERLTEQGYIFICDRFHNPGVADRIRKLYLQLVNAHVQKHTP